MTSREEKDEAVAFSITPSEIKSVVCVWGGARGTLRRRPGLSPPCRLSRQRTQVKTTGRASKRLYVSHRTDR